MTRTTPAATTDGQPSPPGRSAVEDVKQASRHLRGTIGAELTRPEEPFSADSTSLLKFHGIYQQDDRDQRRARAAKKLPLAYSCMVRTSVPGGVLSAEQWLALDGLTDKLADGSLRITTRQGIQYHFVAKEGLRPLIATLNEHLVTTKGACGDIVRNVSACPAPHHDRRQHELLAAAQHLAERFRPRTGAYYELWVDGERAATAEEAPAGAGDGAAGAMGAPEDEPLYGETYLPRKFKISLAWPGDNCVDIFAQDVGVVPHEGGYVVLAGGGLGMSHSREDDTYPRLASPVGWVPAERLGATVEAIITTQRDFGNREDRHRARLKYTIDDRGLDWFRAEVADRAGAPFGDAPPLPPWRDSDEHLGWSPQADGRWFLGVHVASGRVLDTAEQAQRSALREVVERYGCETRLTARQDVLLCGIDDADRAGVESILRRHRVPLAEELRPVRRLAMACPALPTSGQALGEAERAMPDLVDGVGRVLDEQELGDLPLRVNVTGCPNGCARPYTAEVGIVGRTKTTYDLYVGGAVGGDRLAERVARDVRLADLPAALAPLLARYRAEAAEGEGFGDFCARVGSASLAALVPVFERRRGRSAPAEADA
jgi:sulfite reductase (ferredoxin)